MESHLAGDAPSDVPISDGERLIKLALYVKEHTPVDFATIRTALHAEYGAYEGTDKAAAQRFDDKVRRRFERDKKTLQDYGLFFKVDEDSRYSIDDEASFAAPVDLTQEEASLLRLLCGALLDDDNYPLKSELRMILVKIGDELDVPDLLPGMDKPAPEQDKPSAGFNKVRKSIDTRKNLRFDYVNSRGQESRRDVQPFGCFLLNKNCYIVAFDPSTGDDRIFRLDRMSHVSVNPARPAVPDFDERVFDASQYYGLPFQFGDEATEVEVRFDEDSAWRAPRLCLHQGTLSYNDDETVTWRVRANDLNALAQWCVENGPGIEPIAPQEAADAYRGGLYAALTAFDSERSWQ